MFIMSIHSLTEGIALGVSFKYNQFFGKYICLTLGIYNIPRGIFTCMTLLPRGFSTPFAMTMTLLSTLPQSIIAVLTASTIDHVKGLLPYLLAFGAGAML